MMHHAPVTSGPLASSIAFAMFIMKILANKLVVQVDGMVEDNQSAFIKEKFIQDNFMMVQQTTKFLHAQKQPRIMLKLDIAKAFDSVSWTFLLELREKLGFRRIWRDLLSAGAKSHGGAGVR
jgi:hypothetical protein